MQKKWVWLVAAGAALASSAAMAAPVTLRVAILDDMNQAPRFKPLVDQFEASHPGIKIDLTTQYRDQLDPFTVQEAGGAAADVFAGYGNLPPEALNENLLLDLTPYIERDHKQALLKDFVPSTLAMMTKNGHIYAFPKYSATGATYYNTQMFADAGLQAPDPNWTWDTFAQFAKKLTITDGSKITQYGYNLNNDWIWVNPWFIAGGVDFSDPTKVPLASPAGIATATYLQNMHKQGGLLYRWGRFLQHQAAMTTSGSWEVLGWSDQKLPIGIAAMPTGPAGKAAQTNNDIVAINRATKHPDEAWTFLSWFFTKPVQEEYLKIFGLQPARISLAGEWLDTLKGQLRAKGHVVPDGLQTFADATAYAVQEPLFSNPQVINNYIMDALNRVIIAGLPVTTTLEEAEQGAEGFLRKGK